MSKANTISVSFRWVSVQPDHRQWKPSNPLLEPLEVMIVIDVPLTPEFIYNCDKLAVGQLMNDKVVPLPILTPTGMRYCIDQLESAMSDEKNEKVNETNQDFDDDWETINN